MKKPDPSRFTGKKADELEMKGFSTPQSPVGPAVEESQSKQIKDQGETKSETVQPSNQDTTVSRYHDTMIGEIRKAVKDFGKEAATHRFTEEEKQAITEIVFRYKKQGIKTSENEITRIAVNFLTRDHLEKGKLSLLEKVLKALNE